jgi:hypothetical protein
MKSIANLAEQLGVTPAIIRSWQINLNLDHPRYSPEEPVYDAQWQAFFGEVARLRKQGQSFSKIRSALATNMPSAGNLPQPGTHPPGNGNGNGTKTAPQAPPPESPAPEPEPAANLSFSFNSREPRSYAPAEDPGHSLVRVQPDAHLPSVQHLQRNMHEALIHQDLTQMAQTYVQLMENYQSLAARYSESTYVLGQLEEKNRSLEALMHEKEQHFQDKEQNLREKEVSQVQRIQELETHLNTLRSSLNRREADLSRQQDVLVTKDEISQVEKQLKLLAVTVFQQQEELARSQHSGFWSKLKNRLFR